MADTPVIPEGFELDNGLPPGFELEEGNSRLAGFAQGGRAIRPHSNFEKLITGEPIQQEQPPATLGGTAVAFGSGAVQGLGQLNWLERYPEQLIRQGLSHLGVEDRLAKATGNNPEGVMTAGFHDPQNTTERVANVAGNVAGSLPIYAATEGVLAPMVLGGTTSAAETGAKGGSAGDIAESGTISAILNALGYGTGKLISKVLTPHPASAVQQANADTLKAAGIDLTAGQETGSKALRRKELMLGHKIDINPEEVPQQQLGQVGMRSTGAPPDELAMNPENVKNAVDRIGATYQRVYGRNNLTIDPQLQAEVAQHFSNYQMVQPDSAMVPLYRELSQNVANFQLGQALSGETYGRTRSILAELERQRSSNAADAANSRMAGQLRQSLDDAFERSIQNKGTNALMQGGPNANALQQQSAQDVGALREARRQYRNLLVMQKASTTGSEAAENEMLTPGALKTAAKSIYGERNYATGQGELTPVSRAATAVLKPMSTSGTAENLEALKDYTLAALIGGSAAGGGEYIKDKEVGGLWPALGAFAGVAGQRGITAARANLLYSPLVQSYLKSRLLSPEASALVKALGAGTGAGVTPAAAPAIKPSVEAIVNALGMNGTNVP